MIAVFTTLYRLYILDLALVQNNNKKQTNYTGTTIAKTTIFWEPLALPCQWPENKGQYLKGWELKSVSLWLLLWLLLRISEIFVLHYSQYIGLRTKSKVTVTVWRWYFPTAGDEPWEIHTVTQLLQCFHSFSIRVLALTAETELNVCIVGCITSGLL